MSYEDSQKSYRSEFTSQGLIEPDRPMRGDNIHTSSWMPLHRWTTKLRTVAWAQQEIFTVQSGSRLLQGEGQGSLDSRRNWESRLFIYFLGRCRPVCMEYLLQLAASLIKLQRWEASLTFRLAQGTLSSLLSAPNDSGSLLTRKLLFRTFTRALKPLVSPQAIFMDAGQDRKSIILAFLSPSVMLGCV